MVDLTGSNSLELSSLYEARKFYKERLFSAKSVPVMPIDFLYENPNYGLANNRNESVYALVDQSSVNLKLFKSTRVYGLNFAVDAFSAFREEYLKAVRENNIPALPLIGEMIPEESYINFMDLYYGYLRSMEGFLINEYIVDYDVVSFRDLLASIRDFVLTMAKDFPITRSGFIDSKNCPLTASGLVIDVGKQDCSEDAQKGELVQSRGFRCFVEYASRHGFLIDKNAPWRLVCDLSSEKMRGYMLSYADPRLSNEDILNTRYRVKSHYDDIYDLQDFIFKLYRTLITNQPFQVRRENKKRAFIPRENVVWYNENEFNRSFWLKTLFDARLSEIGRNLEYPEYDSELEQIINTHNILDIRASLGLLGQIISSKKRRNTNIDSYKSTKVKDYIR